MCVRLCVFNQTNKLQSFRCGGGLIKSQPAVGGEAQKWGEETWEGGWDLKKKKSHSVKRESWARAKGEVTRSKKKKEGWGRGGEEQVVERRDEVKRPGQRSEGIAESHRGRGARGKEHQEFFWGNRQERRGWNRPNREKEAGEVRREEERRGWGGWARGPGRGEARATDQEPGSRGTEQVQAASEAFGPEGAARA